MRDYTIVAFPGTTALTTPMPVAGTQTLYTTCPGQSQTINLTFNDSTATDSVFVAVTSPLIPGWTFTSSTTAAAGTGTATISWTTPMSMNPATLPQFYFLVSVHDNSCPASAYAQYAVAVQTRQCSTDSVWPGDANADYTVNVYDPLAIAVAYGKTGSTRTGASLAWQAQYCTDWVDTFSNGVNMKHADCNGDGTVDNTDLTAVTTNWGSVHVKGGTKQKTTAVPDLYFDISGINFTPGSAVSIPIKLGSSSQPMNNIYGLATNITVGGITLASAPTVTYPTSWIGSSANTISFNKSGSNIGSLYWAYSRKDHQNISGQGTIAMLNFIIPSNVPNNTQLQLGFTGTSIVTNSLSELPVTSYNENDTSVTIINVGIGGVVSNISYAMVVPNPSSGSSTSLKLMLGSDSKLDISVSSVTGQSIQRMEFTTQKGEHSLNLPAVAPGIYFIKLSDGNTAQTIKWIVN